MGGSFFYVYGPRPLVRQGRHCDVIVLGRAAAASVCAEQERGATMIFPLSLTDEEEALQKKYAKLKKKKKNLLALKKQSSTNQTIQGGVKRSLSDQPVVDTAMATEQAKMLVKTGAISAIKAENKNSGFKRSRTLEGKLKDPEKGPVPTFQPFQRSMSTEEEASEASRRLQRKSLYESFVSSSDQIREAEKEIEEGRESEKDAEREGARHGDREVFDRGLDPGRERERDRERGDRDRGDRGDRERDRDFRRSDSYPDRRAPRKGNTVYVNGVGMTKNMLRSAFDSYGKIIDLSTDTARNCAFVTFEKMEHADQAIAELNGTTVENVHLKVSIARKQPMLEAATGNSVWGSLSVQNNSKGSHRDKRAPVVYNEDMF